MGEPEDRTVTHVRPAELRDAAAIAALVQEMHVLHATALPDVTYG